MISVCMATYNGAAYIREQLASILSQLGKSDEVIISDDGSTDQTLEYIHTFNDNRITIYKNEGRKGVIWNFENALAKAGGDIIFISDQDDIWCANKVSTSLKCLEKFDFVMSNAEFFGNEVSFKYPTTYDWRKYKKGFLRNLIKPNYLGCTFAFNRSVLKTTLPFPEKIAAHDVWIGLCAEIRFKSTYIIEPLIQYRRHGDNVSNIGQSSSNSYFFMLQYRLYFFYHIAKRFFSRRNNY